MVDWTIIKILGWTESYFKKHSQDCSPQKNTSPKLGTKHIPRHIIDSPRLTAEILLAHCLGIKRLDLYIQYDRPLEKQELSDFKAFIKRRLDGEPVAYITGTKGFFESEFDVVKGVLIPRPDTETLVESALDFLSLCPEKIGSKKIVNTPSKKVLELGVGSGAIIISLAKAAPGHQYFANDVSLIALDLARKNGQKIVKDQVCFFAGAWFSCLQHSFCFDLIVSNPPYIPTHDIQNLQPEIKEFEPMLALDGGPDGLDCYRILLAQAHEYLVAGGILMLEIGFDQREGINLIVQNYPQYESIEFVKDLAGHDRVVKIKKTH
ncbi:MAG: peptide chain release factor N(5)-glutamine methyltransferase [Pseudomonadota bacterium]